MFKIFKKTTAPTTPSPSLKAPSITSLLKAPTFSTTASSSTTAPSQLTALVSAGLFLAIVVAVAATLPLPSYSLSLSQDYVLKKTLEQSPYLNKIKWQNRRALSRLKEKQYSLYNTQWSLQWSSLDKNNPLTSPFIPVQEHRKNFQMSLKQRLPFGLQFSSTYTDLNNRSMNSEFLSQVDSPNFSYNKNISLGVDLDLLKNSFGYQERLAFSIFDLSKTLLSWKYLEETEQLVLKATGQYWKVYIAWASLEQIKQSYRGYGKLVRESRNKKQYNFLRPGERPQILAEYENLKQVLLEKERDYQDNLKELMIILNLEKTTKIRFRNKTTFPLPKLSFQKSLKKLRLVKIKNQQLKEQAFQLKISKNNLLPSLRLQGKKGWLSGSSEESDYKFLKIPTDKEFYEFGFKLSYPLFSKSSFAKVQAEKYKLKEQTADFNIFMKELELQKNSLQKQVLIAYKNLNSSKKVSRYRRQAFSEIRTSFYQGRVDTSQMIMAENQMREAEVKKAIALSQYSLALLNWKALTDQLVEPYIKSESL